MYSQSTSRFREGVSRGGLVVLVMATALVLGGVGFSPQVQAAIIVVDSLADNLTAGDGSVTLREAIRNANANADTTGGDAPAGTGADEIRLPVGTVTLSLLGTGDNLALTGDLDLTDSAGVTIIGSGSDVTTVDGASIDRVFDATSGNVIFQDLTITGGSTLGIGVGEDGADGTGQDGGAIRCDVDNISFVLDKVTIHNNTALRDGGGVAILGATNVVSVTSSVFSSNTASIDDGGGFLNVGAGSTITVVDSVFSNNNARDFGGGFYCNGAGTTVSIDPTSFTGNTTQVRSGGGIHFQDEGTGSLWITQVTFQNNISNDIGGAINFYSSTPGGDSLVVDSSLFEGNETGGDGGAIAFGGDVTTSATATLTDSVFRNNVSGDEGGAVCFRHPGTTVASVTGSTFSGNTSPSDGGAISNIGDDTSLTLTGCTIDGNQANRGAGLSDFGASTTLSVATTQVSANQATSEGGGIWYGVANGSFAISQSQIENNTAGVSGGGLSLVGSLTTTGIVDTLFAGNVANASGGGIHHAGLFDSFMISGSTIRDNTAESGAGAHVVGLNFTGTVVSSSIYDNIADIDGGGVYYEPATAGGADTGSLTLRNTTVSSNQAGGDGGGLYTDSAIGTVTLTLNNVTVANNTAVGDGGGLDQNGTSAVNVANTIVAINVDPGGEAPDVSSVGGITSSDYNLLGNSFGSGWIAAANDILDTDPVLGPLALNGGTSMNHAPLQGSPAIEGANPGATTGFPNCESDDQRGLSRPIDGDGDSTAVCDIGAIETQVTEIVMTKLISSDPIIAGTTFTYTLDVANLGPLGASNVVVVDPLPITPELTILSINVGQGTHTEIGGNLNWQVGSLPAGASVAATIVMDASLALPAGTVVNTATATSEVVDSTPSNNVDTLSVSSVAPVADLAVTKVDDIDPLNAGNALTYTLQVSNAGPTDATDVELVDTLPAETTFVSATTSQGTYGHASGVVTFTIGTMIPGSTVNVTVSVIVDATAVGGTIINAATVSASATDPNVADNSVTEDTTIVAQTPTPTFTPTFTNTFTPTFTPTETFTPTPTPTLECYGYALSISCSTASASPSSNGVTFYINQAIPSGCATGSCLPAMVACTIDCSDLDLSSNAACEGSVDLMVEQLAACFNAGFPATVSCNVIPVPDGHPRTIHFDSKLPLSFSVCGGDSGIPDCSSGNCQPIVDDPSCQTLFGLCDGALNITLFETGCFPTPTPTQTATVTPTPTETMFPVAQAGLLVISCSGTHLQGETFGPMHLRLRRGPAPSPNCVPIPCTTEDILVDWEIDCANIIGVTDCDDVTELLLLDFGAAITAQAPGVLSWTAVTGPGAAPGSAASFMLVDSATDYHCCLCGEEFGLPCEQGLGWPIGNCPVYNVCNGISGDESQLFFGSGLGFECIPGEFPPRPTDTPTPTNTATFTPTFTPTSTGTFTPTLTYTPTYTATFVPTETFTPTFTLTDTPTETPTETSTETPTETSTETPVPTEPIEGCDSGYYILDSLGGRHRVGNPYSITGPLYFGYNIARDMERAVCDDGFVTNEDLVVLDGNGAGHFVQNPDACVIVQDFYFGNKIVEFPEGRAIDIEMSADSEGFWVLTDFGGIHRAGSVKEPTDPALIPGTDQTGVLGFDIPITVDMERDPDMTSNGTSLRAVSFIVIDTDANSRAEGYVVLDSMGGRYHYAQDGSPVVPGSSAVSVDNDPTRLLDPSAYVWPFFPGLDIARDMELFSTQQGVVILDGWDGIHPVPVDIEDNPVYFANNRVSNADDTPVQTVGLPYVVTGFDDPDTVGEDEGNTDEFGYDAESIFTDLEFSSWCANGMYTLDKFGGVFALGDVRADPNQPVSSFNGSPYFYPLLYAEDMELFAPDESEVGPGPGPTETPGPGPTATPDPGTEFSRFRW